MPKTVVNAIVFIFHEAILTILEILISVNTPQAPSLYSDVADESDVGFVFQSGLSTVMAAFGADIQNHLKVRLSF